MCLTSILDSDTGVLPGHVPPILVCLLLAAQMCASLCLAQTEQVGEARAGGVPAAQPKFRLLRSISGSKGEEKGGQFVLQDPRTVFYIPDDRQVIGYFEWEGAPGSHDFEGTWKNPQGRVAVVSSFTYEARQKRFAAYWTLLLGEDVPTGIWVLEARVDGELAGVHNFQIVSGTKPAPASPVRRMLAPAEIYELGVASTVTIESLDQEGRRLNLGSGFVLAPGTVVTAFEVIDGASFVRVMIPPGRSLTAGGLLAWNRLQDWALLRAGVEGVPALNRAESGSWAVGDRCYVLDVSQEGTHTLVDGNITGRSDFHDLGERLSLSLSLRPQASGSPVFNEYGEVIGFFAPHSLLPGSASLEGKAVGHALNLFLPQSPFYRQQALGVPVTLIPASFEQGSVTPPAELGRSGQFTPALGEFRDIVRGTLASEVEKTGGTWRTVDEKFEFSRRDGQMAVCLHWFPRQKGKATAICRLYDLRNRTLVTSDPTPVKFRAERLLFSAWKMPLADLPPGVYRVDVLLDLTPVWRTFFRLVQ